VGVELIIAGVVVGILVGATGMGAGSLMAPLLITVFNVPALSVVGTDLLYSGASKAVGAWRHRTLDTVNTQLAWWMASGSVPAAATCSSSGTASSAAAAAARSRRHRRAP